MTPQSPKNPEKVRKTLLAAAYREIHLYGYQAASVTNILAETGLTKGALYHHFPTKQALGLAVVEAFIRPKFALLIEDLKGTKGLEALIPALREWVRQMDDERVRRGCPLNNLLNEMSPLDPMFQGELLTVIHEWQTALEGAFRRSQQVGTIRNGVNCKETAWFIISAWQGGTGMAKLTNSKQPLNACLRQLETILATISSPVPHPGPNHHKPAPTPAPREEKQAELPPAKPVSMDWD